MGSVPTVFAKSPTIRTVRPVLSRGAVVSLGMAGRSVERDSANVSRVVGVVLSFVGLALTCVFFFSPSLLSPTIAEASLSCPIVPASVLLLGVTALIISSRATGQLALWLARFLLIALLLACATAVLELAGTPLSPMDGAFTLWTTPQGVWPQARSEIWLSVGAIVLLVATFRNRVGVVIAQWASLVAIVAALFASLVFVFGSGAPVGTFVTSVAILLVPQACATCTLHMVSKAEGFAPGPAEPRAQSLLLVASTSSMLLPLVALSLAALASDAFPVIASWLVVSVLAIAALAAVVALRGREAANRKTTHELGIVRSDGDAAEAAGGYGTWKLDPIHDFLALSSQAGKIMRTGSLRGFADSIADGTHPDDMRAVTAWLEKVRAEAGSHCVTVRNVQSSETRWIEICALRSHQDDYPVVHGTVRDVTSETAEKAKLEQGLRLLEALAEKVPDIDYVFDTRTQAYAYTNRPVGELLGFRGVEYGTFLEDHVLDVHKEALAAYLQTLSGLSDNDVHEVEFLARGAGGASVWLRNRASVFQRDSDGTPVLIFGTLQDVTERRELMRRLQESEARYERISDRTPGVIYQFAISAEGEISIPYMSAGCIDVFGVTREVAQSTPMQVMGMVHDAERAGLMDAIESSRQLLTDFSWIGRIIRPDGKTAWIQASSRPLRLDDGSTVWDGVIIDVTDAKVSQEALQRTKERLDYLLSESPTVVYECEPLSPFSVISVAPNIRNLLGFLPEQLVGRPLFGTQFVHESDHALFRLHERRFIDHGRSTSEYRLRTISGDYAWVRDDVRIVSNGGAAPDVVGCWTDVTAQRSSMQKTLDSESRLQRLASRVDGMVFELAFRDEVTPEFTYVSSGAYDLFELSPEEVRARPESFLRMIDLQDKARLYRDIVRTRRDLTDLSWEGAVTIYSGSTKWMSISARPFADDSGGVTWAGVVTDVTDHREALRAADEHNLRYAALVNSCSEAIVTVDSHGAIVSVNPRAERALGYLSHELIGLPAATLSATGHEHPFALEESDAGKRTRMGLSKRDGSVETFEVTVAVSEIGGKRHLTGIMSEVRSSGGARRMAADRAIVELAGEEQSLKEPKTESTVPQVLFIAREHELERLLGPNPGMTGMSITVATTAGLGLEIAKRERPDAVVLVEGLPDADIVSALEAIRADDDLRSVPVVVVGAPADRRDRLERSGATALADQADVRRVILLALNRTS